MTLDEARQNIDRPVTYHAPGQDGEDGEIAFVGKRYIFVRYGADMNPRATDPAALTLRAGTR